MDELRGGLFDSPKTTTIGGYRFHRSLVDEVSGVACYTQPEGSLFDIQLTQGVRVGFAARMRVRLANGTMTISSEGRTMREALRALDRATTEAWSERPQKPRKR